MNSLAQVIGALREMENDSTVPKNLKQKLASAVRVLESEGAPSMLASKVLCEMETISDDVNLPSHMRTQLFGIISMLEIVE